MQLELHPSLQVFFPQKNPAGQFAAIMALEGKIYRQQPGRCTQRIQLGNQQYFIKKHFGTSLKEIFKNILQLRLPVLSARNEKKAIERLHALHIATMNIVGFGTHGCYPPRAQSFLITDALVDTISLEDVCRDWKQHPPAFTEKLSLLKKVAAIARKMHTHGINHRDFYLCHFLIPRDRKNDTIYLIDLHRAQLRKKTPTRWLLKDLAGLYFSSLECGLTKRDYARFVKLYRQRPLRAIVIEEKKFWEQVKQRGDALYDEHCS